MTGSVDLRRLCGRGVMFALLKGDCREDDLGSCSLTLPGSCCPCSSSPSSCSSRIVLASW